MLKRMVHRPLAWKQSRIQSSLQNEDLRAKTDEFKTLEPRLLPSSPKDSHNAQEPFSICFAWFNCLCKLFVTFLGGITMRWSCTLTKRICWYRVRMGYLDSRVLKTFAWSTEKLSSFPFRLGRGPKFRWSPLPNVRKFCIVDLTRAERTCRGKHLWISGFVHFVFMG